MLRGVASVVGLAGAFVGVLFLAYSGDSVPTASPTETPAPGDPPLGSAPPSLSPSPSPLLDFVNGAEVIPLVMGTEIDFPNDVALIVETGCWQCDGPTTGFQRIYRDAAGSLRIDELLSHEKLGLEPRIVEIDQGPVELPPNITGFATRADASLIVVSVCLRGTCAGTGLDAWSPDSRTALFRSRDGGVTWEKLQELEVGAFVVDILDDETVLIGTWDTEFEATFRVFPSMDPLKPPAPRAWVAYALGGDVIWQTAESQMIDDDGQLYPSPALPPELKYFTSLVESTDGTASRLAATDLGTNGSFVLQLAKDGNVVRAWHVPGFLRLGVWQSPQHVYGNTNITSEQLQSVPTEPFAGYLPALIDLEEGLIHPITRPFLHGDLPGGRNHITAAQQGPFARVVNTGGTCLNIRTEPGVGAPALDCAADGVLLRDLIQLCFLEGYPWIRVRTPAGVDGWVSQQYLEMVSRERSGVPCTPESIVPKSTER